MSEESTQSTSTQPKNVKLKYVPPQQSGQQLVGSVPASIGGAKRKVVVKTTNNVYLTRPARRQAQKGTGPIRAEFTHHSSEYNIWYHKKLGDRFEKDDTKIKAATRCCVATDAGYTRGDRSNKDTYICIFFARGHCVNGPDCNYYHRIPTEEDELKLDLTHDIFGRERHRTYRDDMGGVGSFSRDNRTLFVTGLKRTNNLEETVTAHFAEWGELEHIKIVWDKAAAFVKYRLRSAAEFAKEAMQDQSLDGSEVLTIRWANEDPNPSSNKEGDTIELAKAAAQKQQAQLAYEAQQQQQQSEEEQAAYAAYYQQYYQQLAQQNAVEEWLKKLDLSQYAQGFYNAGYYDLSMVSQLDEYGLDAVGVVDLDDRVKLLTAASELGSSNDFAYYNQEYNNQYYYNDSQYQQYYQQQQTDDVQQSDETQKTNA